MKNSADPDQLGFWKPTDLDLHCLQIHGIPGLSMTEVKQIGILGCFYPPIFHGIGYQDFFCFVYGCKNNWYLGIYPINLICFAFLRNFNWVNTLKCN